MRPTPDDLFYFSIGLIGSAVCYFLYELYYYIKEIKNQETQVVDIDKSNSVNLSFNDINDKPSADKSVFLKSQININNNINYNYLSENTGGLFENYYKLDEFDRYTGGIPWQFQTGFQAPASPQMEGILILHNDLLLVQIIISMLVLFLLFLSISLFHNEIHPVVRPIKNPMLLEFVWTIIPTFILIALAIPTFALLYATETYAYPFLTFKAIGHQWYWSYEYSGYDPAIVFDSIMIPGDEILPRSQYLYLEVDHRVILPYNVHVRAIITSTDVIHSWAIPSLGIKVDAVPGRLNVTNLFIKYQGVFRGQCAELCGVNHAFMPILIETVPISKFKSQLLSNVNV